MKNARGFRLTLCALIAAVCAAQTASAYSNHDTVALPNGLSARDLTLLPDCQYWPGGAPLVRVKIENPTPKEQSVTIVYGSHDSFQSSSGWKPSCSKTSSVVNIRPGASAVAEIPIVDASYGGWATCIRADVPHQKSVTLTENACSAASDGEYYNAVYVPSSAFGESLKALWNAYKASGHSYTYYTEFAFTSAASCADPWPEDARAYMPFNAVFIETKQLPAISSGARAALRDYVAQGGLVFFAGMTALPAGFTKNELFAPVPDSTLSARAGGGFAETARSGYGFVAAIGKMPECENAETDETQDSVQRRGTENKTSKIPEEDAATVELMFATVKSARDVLSISSDTLRKIYKAPDHSNDGIATGPFLLLLTVFAIVFGPVALRVLARRGKRVHILWILPAGSLVFCGAILLWITVSDGILPRLERDGVTFIDQRLGRAFTTGSATVRATHRLGADLVFSKNSQIIPRGDFGGGVRSAAVDSAQRLAGHWAPARTPVSFAVRRIEADPRRIDVKFDAEGRPTAVNALGAALETLAVCNCDGDVFLAENIAAGATVTPAEFRPADPAVMALHPEENARKRPDGLRNFYKAVFADDCPFVEDPLEGRAAHRSAKGTVYGTF